MTRAWKLAAAVAMVFVVATVSAAQDAGWPREVSKDGSRLIFYQPQVDEWKDFKELQIRMAVSITPAGGKAAVGALTLRALTEVNTDNHMVLLTSFTIAESHFPSLDPASATRMDQLVRTVLPQTTSISLHRLVASVPKPGSVPTLPVKNDPPKVFVSHSPAILLFIDGEPVLGQIKGTKLEFVVNTSWPLFLETQSSKYYLLVDKQWLVASKLEGPWKATTKLPGEMSKLVKDPEWKDLKKVIPPPAGAAAAAPRVFLSTVPAEVILFNGKPLFARIPGTQLLYATNTDSNLFMDEASKQYYYLSSGRWFRAPSSEGPWTYATPDLPADFARIPSKSPASRVLVSVPGTDEAKDAALLAQVPTTVVVNPVEAAAKAKATYDGEPKFKPIGGTSLSYATNTSDKVIKVGDLYYLCLQGIWFISKAPTGPWKTAESIPKEIYTIPPSSPVYNVTYVTQTTKSDGNVEASHTAGYMGAFVIGTALGVVIANGTGYYYPPYIYYPYYGYPIYHPYPMPYGVPIYNTVTGAYGWGQAAYGPYGGAARAATYNPYTGTYARGATAYGPYGSRTVAQAYNPYTGTYAATRQGSNPYSQWGSSVISRGGETAYTQHYTDSRGTVGSIETSSGGKAIGAKGAGGESGFVGKTGSGDMYAGKDGNVYRNTGDGWQKYDNGNWTPVAPTTPTSTSAQASAQQRAQQRTTSAPGTTSATQTQAQQRTTTGSAPTSTAQTQAQQRAQASGVSRESVQQQAQQRTSSFDRQGSPAQMQNLQQERQNRQRGEFQSQRVQQYQRSAGATAGGRTFRKR